MNGAHDMGGQHGHGPVRPEPDEPRFHAAWERRALGLTLAMGATRAWNLDMTRAARERLGASTYLSSSYYEIWLRALERMLLERGLVNAEELAAGHARGPGQALPRVLQAADVDAVLARGAPTERAAPAAARFQVGQRVRMRNHQPASHTRLPAYVRGHVGLVEAVHGAHVFPDRHALPRADGAFDESPTWLYTVCFAGSELWGPHGDGQAQICVDAWEPYLEPAESSQNAPSTGSPLD